MFDFKHNYIIKNDIVELIPLNIEHLEELFLQSNNRDIWKYFTENGFGKANFENYISNAIQKRKDEKEYPFTIRDLRSNQLAGMTRIYNLESELKNIKIGHTWIGQKFQGTGLNKNCKYVLFKFLFETLMIERIGFGANSENIKSIEAMNSVGCQQEGTLRAYLPGKKNNSRIDVVLLSILKKEWNENVKEELGRKIKANSQLS